MTADFDSTWLNRIRFGPIWSDYIVKNWNRQLIDDEPQTAIHEKHGENLWFFKKKLQLEEESIETFFCLSDELLA